MSPIAPSAMAYARPAHLPSPLSAPDTPGLTSSSSAGLFSASSHLDTAYFTLSPISPLQFVNQRGEQKHHAVPGWERSVPNSPQMQLQLTIHQYHVGDYDGSNGIYEHPVPVPPNTPSVYFPSNDQSPLLRRRRKPLPFLTQFMDSQMMKDFLDDEEFQEIRNDGVRPQAPIKSAFREDGPEVPLAYEAWLDSCELHISSLTKEERARRVQSLKLQPIYNIEDSDSLDSSTSKSSTASSRNVPLPRLNTNLGSASKPSFQFLLSDDESLKSARLRGAITLTISSPIYSAQPSAKPQRRWTIGVDEDDLFSPRSALLSPMSTMATGFNTSSFMDTPSPSPISGRPLCPSLPSLSDPALMTTWQVARQTMLSCGELARSERHFLASLKDLRGYEASVPCVPAVLIRELLPPLIEASEAFVDAMGRVPSVQVAATAFLDCEPALRSAFTAWSQAIHSLNLSVAQQKTLRDVMELPMDHASRYLFLFQDMLAHSSPSTPSWSAINAAVTAVMGIINACEEAVDPSARPLVVTSSPSRIVYSCFSVLQGLWKLYHNARDDQSTRFVKRAEGFDKNKPEDIVFAILIPILTLLSGLFAGLTLGYMSLDETQLNVLSISGTPKQREYANKIKPIRKNGHLLLVTLLLSNMIVNETLPVISENVLGGGAQSVVVSTVLIVIFAEIIPQSLFTRYGLYLGAKFATLTKCLIYALGIISWPTAKLLEFILGHHGIIYRRAELKELINMHSSMQHHGGDLASDTVTIIGATLDLQEKVAMTPISDVFMLSIEARLDYATLKRITDTGHSRVPVYEEVYLPNDSTDAFPEKPRTVKRIIGVLLVKQCVLLDPKEAVPLRSIQLNKIPSIPQNASLLTTLDSFQEGRSHIAVVSRHRVEKAHSVKDAEEVVKRSLTQKLKDTVGISDSDSDESDAGSSVKRRGSGRKGDIESSGTADGTPRPSKKANLKPATMNLEQSFPDDAVLDEEGAKDFLQILDPFIMPLGIITLEDILEELIGEEIYDEFDHEGAHGEPLRAPLVESPTLPESKGFLDVRPPANRRRKLRIHRSRSAPSSPRPTQATLLGADTPADLSDTGDLSGSVTPTQQQLKRGSLEVSREMSDPSSDSSRNGPALATPLPHRPASATVASLLLERKRRAVASSTTRKPVEPSSSEPKVPKAAPGSRPTSVSFRSSPIPSILELSDSGPLPELDITEDGNNPNNLNADPRSILRNGEEMKKE
ncbi:hypothetical protein ONZ45_g4831 [Pleurotus djamor]|nr:hypothetical protein ONZ45_g4831 [Pleurotus djamor]